MEIEIRNPWHPEDAKHYTTDRMRNDFLIQDLFTPDKVRLVSVSYTHLIYACGKFLGIIGQVHPKVAANFKIGVETYCALLDFNVLLSGYTTDRQYKACLLYTSKIS